MSESATDDESPKIVVDSDWKEQVAKEKEAAAVAAEASGPVATASEASSDDVVKSDDAGKSEASIPPATFDVLLSMLFTQAMTMLGQIPDPASGETRIDKPIAKHTIDMMEMLGEKTQGNLTDDESKMLSEALHAIRMAYVSAR